jgi:hypothetical protein
LAAAPRPTETVEADSSSGPLTAASPPAAVAPRPPENDVEGLAALLSDQALTPIDTLTSTAAANNPSNGPPFQTSPFDAIDLAGSPLPAAPVAGTPTTALDALFAQDQDSYGVFGDPLALPLQVM